MRRFDKPKERRPIPEGERLLGETADSAFEPYIVTDEVCAEAVEVQRHLERGDLPEWHNLPRTILA